MFRDYRNCLEDILEAIASIREYTAGFSLQTFASDRKTIDAVIRNLEVIGEAVKAVPEPIRARHPEVEWKRVAGLRDILIHQYFGVNVKIVWDIVQNKLPSLEKSIRSLLAS